MTLLDLQTRTLQRVGEDLSATPGYYTVTEVTNALNAAQRLFVLRTLCLETTATFNLATDGTAFYHMMSTFSDWLLPLRVRISAGAKLKPSRLSDLAALDASWSTTRGTPDRYAHLGFDLLATNKQPNSATTLSLTYARCPATMASPTDTPEIPSEYQPDLVNGAIPLLRLKEGAQEFQKVLPRWESFTAAADKLASYVRARNKEQGYDFLPVELSRFDMSEVMEVTRG